MTIAEAAALIRCPALDGVSATWGELGAGSGTFTLALAELLARGSRVIAVDRDADALTALPVQHHGVVIERRVADFATDLALPAVDGVLIANALHFVRDQASVLRRCRDVSPQLLVVEYAGRRPGPWVPYPVDPARFAELAAAAGFGRVVTIGSRRSAFGGRMYAALAAV